MQEEGFHRDRLVQFQRAHIFCGVVATHALRQSPRSRTAGPPASLSGVAQTRRRMLDSVTRPASPVFPVLDPCAGIHAKGLIHQTAERYVATMPLTAPRKLSHSAQESLWLSPRRFFQEAIGTRSCRPRKCLVLFCVAIFRVLHGTSTSPSILGSTPSTLSWALSCPSVARFDQKCAPTHTLIK